MSGTCNCQSVFCFSCVCVHWFGSDLGLCRLLVAVSLCSVSVGSDIGLCWLLVAFSLCSVSVGSDLGLCQLLVAFSLCSVSVVIVCIRYQALSATCSCQSVFCFSCVCVH